MLKVALIQLMVTASKNENLLNACRKVKLAADRGAKLICLPECFNTPFGSKYFKEFCESISEGNTAKTLGDLAKQNSVWLVGGSMPELRDGKIYNTSIVFNPNGEIVGQYSKIHLFDIDIPGRMTFKESDTIDAGNKLLSFDIPISDNKNVTVGIAICYDLRFPELAQIYTRERNCNLLLYPGVFNMVTGPLHWELLGRSRANDNQCYVGLCSAARDTSAEYVGYGHSMAVDPWGRIIKSLDEKEDILEFEIDPNEVNEVRASIPVRSHRSNVYSIAKEIK